jgi:hypothetical protein
MTDHELDQALVQKQIEFLKTASPDDWHRIADEHNWDTRLDILYWIVSQPECDKATALLIFWKGEPIGHDFEDEQEKMGVESYAVEPMLKYIVQRFNLAGYTRSEIAFDMLEATGSAGSEPFAGYAAMVSDGIQRDFDELVARREKLTDPSVMVPDDMMVFSTPGRNVGIYHEHSNLHDIYASYPRGVNYDSGEFIYSDTIADAAAIDETASLQIRAMRQKMKLGKASPYEESEEGRFRTQEQEQEKGKTGFFDFESDRTWFFFYVIGLGYTSVAFLAFTSEKFYWTVGWIGALIIILWESWDANSSFQSFRSEIPLPKLTGAVVIGLLCGVLISIPAFASVLILKKSFGVPIAALVALTTMVPLQWIISAIFGRAYLKPIS